MQVPFEVRLAPSTELSLTVIGHDIIEASNVEYVVKLDTLNTNTPPPKLTSVHCKGLHESNVPLSLKLTSGRGSKNAMLRNVICPLALRKDKLVLLRNAELNDTFNLPVLTVVLAGTVVILIILMLPFRLSKVVFEMLFPVLALSVSIHVALDLIVVPLKTLFWLVETIRTAWPVLLVKVLLISMLAVAVESWRPKAPEVPIIVLFATVLL